MLTDEKRNFLNRLKEERRPFDKELCAECGGECCKAEGCILLPWDIEPFTAENIQYLLDKGYYSIRAFFESGKAYAFMQVRERGNGPFAILSPHGRCNCLTEEGCLFFDEERPTLGLSLIPKPGFKCESIIEVEEFENYWKDPKVVEVMAEVLKKYIMNHPLEKIVETLLMGFESSVMDGTCSYNFIAKYTIYQDGIKFGYKFKEGFPEKLYG